MIFGKKERILYGNRFNGTKGNGYQPIKKVMTNEEWIKQCNTEQLAEFIDNILEHCADMDCGGCYMHHGGNCNYKDIVEWLKEEHK